MGYKCVERAYQHQDEKECWLQVYSTRYHLTLTFSIVSVVKGEASNRAFVMGFPPLFSCVTDVGGEFTMRLKRQLRGGVSGGGLALGR